jgi:hypothetical protein
MTAPDARLGQRIPPSLARRLKLTAAVSGTTMRALLVAALERQLPTDDELAALMKGTGNDDADRRN